MRVRTVPGSTSQTDSHVTTGFCGFQNSLINVINNYSVLVSSGTGSRVCGKSGARVDGAQSTSALLSIRIMLVALVCCLAVLAAATAAPATYDQRQDGDFNYDVDVRNIVVLGIYPSNFPTHLFMKNAKHNRESEAQERADVHAVLEAFVEPSEPYHVEIGDDGRQADGGDGRAVEVVIAARRRPDVVLQAADDTPPDQQRNTADADEDEYKLIGATEQCGPDRDRDPVTLICRARLAPPVAAAPDAPASSAAASPAAAPMQQQITIQHASPEVVPASS